MIDLDHTHDPALQSWVRSANTDTTDFPIQNLPFGRFKLPGESDWRVGVAIGDQVLDLHALGADAPADMPALLNASLATRLAIRHQLCAGLRQGAAQQAQWQHHLHPQEAVTLGLPCDIRDYTDFYAGIHHAMAVGKLFRPDNPLLPNYRWVPIAYHGRASTILPSGQPFKRPHGQVKLDGEAAPVLRATQRLDFELEIGIIIGRGNDLGTPIPLPQAENHVFGLTLFNDWSARDIQAWEYQPLGPFLSKNFASSISPWIVTLEALAPFRAALSRPDEDPPSLSYLENPDNNLHGAFDINLEVFLQTKQMRQQAHTAQRISQSNFCQAAYWTIAQMVAHHTVNGCALSPGDLFGTGTLSGPNPEQSGSLLELTDGGKHPITLDNTEQRQFLQDGDAVTFKGHCSRPGFRRIGFGLCEATVMPAGE